MSAQPPARDGNPDGRTGPVSRSAAAEAAQRRYAVVLDRCARIAFVLLLAGFVLYVSGLLPADVPLDRLPRLWRLSSDAYLAETGAPHGWQWLRRLPAAEAVNLGAITLLVLAGIAATASVVVLLWRRGDRVYAALAVGLLLVNAIVASGFLA